MKTNDSITAVGGYLAVYPAKYEPDMGAEHAQFPSKEYTNTYRTDVLYYAVSKDGATFEPLNNNKAVMYPQGCLKLGAPSLFRRRDGGYGLIASVDNVTSEILLYDSDDLLYYKNQRKITLGKDGRAVKNPTVIANESDYTILWESDDGKAYSVSTVDFKEFSEPTEASYAKNAVDAALPEYAVVEEASVFPLTTDEYDRIVKKYGKLHSVAVKADDVSVRMGERAELPEKVNVVYSDGSETPMKVTWDTEGLDLDNLSVGEYDVCGTITATSEYNSPLADCRADPYAVYDEENGVYYFTGSNMNENSANGGGAYQSVVIRKADSINGITDAEEFEIWRDATLDDGTKVTGFYWAPEIHKIGGKWRIIVLASVTEPGEERSRGRQCIFTCNGDDLTDARNWEYTGYIHDTPDGQSVGSFDTTYFEHNGKCYYVTPKWACIWITEVDPADPTHPISPLVKISSADRGFETNIGSAKAGWNNMKDVLGQGVQEASSILKHGDKIFIVYAGCTVDMMYCVCVLYADIDSDLTDPDSWHKYPYPILASQDLTKTVKTADYEATDGTDKVTGHGDSGLLDGAEGEYVGIFGPGHNSFTVDEIGNPVIIYHARDWSDSYPGAVGSEKYGLLDPGRHAYARPVIFNYEGYPVCNLSADEYLMQDLKKVHIKITVKE